MMAVVDTSALLRLFVPDGPIPDGMESAFRESERGNDILLAPELLIAEAAQVLLKKKNLGLLSSQEMEDLLDSIISLPIRLFSHKPLVQRASKVAQEYKITVYDALFLTLAEQKSARLITADRVLQKAALKLGL